MKKIITSIAILIVATACTNEKVMTEKEIEIHIQKSMSYNLNGIELMECVKTFVPKKMTCEKWDEYYEKAVIEPKKERERLLREFSK